MVKAGKWLRSILTGKKEKKQEKEMEGWIWLHLPPPPPPPPTTPEEKKSRRVQLEMEKQNPAVQFEDVAARKASFSTIEDVAAIMIQASFRSFLARKALRALKGLVKLQAVVRGFLVRKQAAATLRSMQALLIAQARARARRVRMVQEVGAAPCRESSQRRLMGEFNFQQLLDMDRTVDMIVDMDRGQSKGNSKSRKINNPITQSETNERRAFGYQKFSSNPSDLTDMSSCSAQFESSSSAAARCSFHYSPPSNKPGRMRSPDEIIMQEGSYLMSHELPLFPNYMAKARSQSAPRQRPDVFDQKQSCKERTSFGGRNSNRVAWVQQSSMLSDVGSTATKDQILWSGGLDGSKRNAGCYRIVAA